jgi:hypothetical protein
LKTCSSMRRRVNGHGRSTLPGGGTQPGNAFALIIGRPIPEKRNRVGKRAGDVCRIAIPGLLLPPAEGGRLRVVGGAPQPMAARTPSPATAAAADFLAWPPAESGRDMLPTGAANFVVGGGANPDKPPPRGASMELARDGGRTSDI